MGILESGSSALGGRRTDLKKRIIMQRSLRSRRSFGSFKKQVDLGWQPHRNSSCLDALAALVRRVHRRENANHSDGANSCGDGEQNVTPR
jgi:hypothetical protein